MAVTGDLFDDIWGDIWTGELASVPPVLPKRPPLPRVDFTIDGMPVEIQDWNAHAAVDAGFDTLTGRIRESDVRRLPNPIIQDSLIRAWVGTTIIWEGTLQEDPFVHRGSAEISALGRHVKLEENSSILLFQDRDYERWQDAHSEPHNYAGADDAYDYESRSSCLFWKTPVSESYSTGDVAHLAAWYEGATITRVRADIDKSGDFGNFDIRLNAAVGPAGAVGDPIADIDLGSGGPGVINQAISGTRDLVRFGMRAKSSAGGGRRRVRLINVRVHGIVGNTDLYVGTQVLQHVGSLLGFNVGRVNSLIHNVMPLVWEDSWDELFTYICDLHDGWWRVDEDRGNGPQLVADTWANSKVWTTSQAHGCAIESARSLRRYKGVIIHFQRIGVRKRPSRQRVIGEAPFWEEELDDPQPNGTLATNVANTLLPMVSSVRYETVLRVVSARDESGRDAIYEIRPGDKITVTDWSQGQSFTHRIVDVELAKDGVRLGCERAVSVARMQALERLRKARRKQARKLRRRKKQQGKKK